MSNNNDQATGKLLVLSAPSGAGKSTLAQMLLQRHAPFRLSVSYTTRAPRGQEQNGVHYHFVSEPEFEAMIARDELLEHAKVFNKNYYGTARATVEAELRAGRHVLFDIDVQGADSLKKIYGPRCITVFILPPSFEELSKRLKGRQTESDEAVRLRLETAKAEMGRAQTFDYRVVNQELDTTFTELEGILRREGLLD